MRRRILLLASVLVLSAGVTSAQVLRVDNRAAPGGDGSSWPRAFRDLQLALSAATSPAEIWVAAGTYKPSTSSIVASFVLPDGVSVFGGFAGTETARDQRDPSLNVTVLDGDLNGDDLPGFVNRADNSQHVVSALGVASAHLDGFTVRGGNIGPGGGIRVQADRATLARLIVKENQARGGTNAGGGASVEARTLSIVDCTFTDDRATAGGALWLPEPVEASIVRCTFERNSATGGGCIGVSGIALGDVSVLDSGFRDSHATDGGGISLSAESFGSLTVDGCSFERCDATSGAGISVSGESPGFVSVSNSVFRESSATSGGGISLNTQFVSTSVVSSCLFERNLACAGGGIFVHTGTVDVIACEFRGNHLPPFCGKGAGGGGIRTSTGRDSVDVRQSLFQDSDHGLLFGENGSRFSATLCTFLQQDNDAAAIQLFGSTKLQLDSSIVWSRANEALLAGSRATVSVTHSDVRTAGAVLPGTGNIALDPLFVDPSNGDLRLGALSPCIEAGDPQLRFAGQDLERDSRLVDGDLDGRLVIDMGADEFSPIHLEVQGTPAPGNTLTFVTTGTPGLAAFLFIGPPDLHLVPRVGTVFTSLTSSRRIAFPATPSTVSIRVPPGVTGLFHVQEIGIRSGAVAVSNYVPLLF